MSEEFAIQVKDVSKIYKLYDRNRDRILDAFGLSKQPRYKEHYALNHLSFDIRRGETVGIIGINGAGKSTILKIITGVLNPTEGEIDIDGRISALLELGAGFNMEYTGIENIYLNGTMMGYSRAEVDQKMEEILSFADIGDFVYQPVKTYSSGMFVRLAFAVAINIDPEILIVDEALSVGDVFFEQSGGMKREGVYYVTGQGDTGHYSPKGSRTLSTYCSRDFIHWTPASCQGFTRESLPPKPTYYGGVNGSQVHLGAGLWDRGNVIIGFYGMWEGHPSNDRNLTCMNLGMVISHDGLHYYEPVPNFPIILLEI